MVTGREADGPVASGRRELQVRIDGGQPLSQDMVAALGAVCDAAEDRAGQDTVVLHVSGVPGPEWPDDLPLALVSKWERGLRRLERLPVVTIAVAEGDCGGAALDTILATDYRIALAQSRLLFPAVAGAIWPGMALYRLIRQTTSIATARRAVLFGAPITAAGALAMGVLDEVAVDATMALSKAREAAVMFQGTDLAVRRQLMFEAPATSFEDALGVHLAACDRVLRRVATGAA
jgi:isomerase DpgB